MLPTGSTHPQELGLSWVNGQAILLRPSNNRRNAVEEMTSQSLLVGGQAGRIQLHIICVAMHGQAKRDDDLS